MSRVTATKCQDSEVGQKCWSLGAGLEDQQGSSKRGRVQLQRGLDGSGAGCYGSSDGSDKTPRHRHHPYNFQQVAEEPVAAAHGGVRQAGAAPYSKNVLVYDGSCTGAVSNTAQTQRAELVICSVYGQDGHVSRGEDGQVSRGGDGWGHLPDPEQGSAVEVLLKLNHQRATNFGDCRLELQPMARPGSRCT